LDASATDVCDDHNINHRTWHITAKLDQVDTTTYVMDASRRAIATPGGVTLPSDLT
jgi:hypothetical protein